MIAAGAWTHLGLAQVPVAVRVQEVKHLPKGQGRAERGTAVANTMNSCSGSGNKL